MIVDIIYLASLMITSLELLLLPKCKNFLVVALVVQQYSFFTYLELGNRHSILFVVQFDFRMC